MRLKLLVLFLFLLTALPAHAQQGGAYSNPLGGNLTLVDAGTCSTYNSFAWQHLPNSASSTTVNLAGTFSATVTIRLSNNGGGTWTTNTTASGVGTTTVATAGFTDICADVTTYASGTVQVTINTGQAIVTSGSGGNSGSGTATSFSKNFIDPTATAYGVKANWQVESIGANFTVTSGSAIVTCTTCKFKTSTYHAAVVADVMFATNWSGNDNAARSSVAVIANGTTPVTIISVDSDTQVHVSVNASGNAGTTNSNTGFLAWGTEDDGTSASSPWSLAENAGYNTPLNCLPIQVPAGITDVTKAHFLTEACRGIQIGATTSRYASVIGWATGGGATFILPPWFDVTGCTGGTSTQSCFGNGNWADVTMNGLGQGNFALGAHNLFETFPDMTYRDLIFSAFAGNASSGTIGGLVIGSGFHDMRNISVDAWGAGPCLVTGNAHNVYGLFCGNSNTSNGEITVIAGGTLGAFSYAVQQGAPTGIDIQVNSTGSFWGYNGLHFGGSATASACVFGAGNMYIYGMQCFNTGNVNSEAISVAAGGFMSIENSQLQGGSTQGVSAVAATGRLVLGPNNSFAGPTTGHTPTCSVTTTGGFGTGATCAAISGATNEKGTLRITTTATAPGASGTITLTFKGTYTGATVTTPTCVMLPANTTTAWNARATIFRATASSTSPTFTADNNAGTFAATAYDVDYNCTPQ